ncbi:MAG: ATP-binding cassette domain-containing protein [Rhodoferax sp.]|uniref:ABC transporter ATP-binding protein n=1 Tax=Rhodoferax sp. TaxID=50421 RepID=UPI0027274879|nr:ATP-binding cassette domain-containing protein [Rhodoferax sp.]MDO8447411.1 ATP-binding cassette domain-containing protein [Rhodoferax sp.]
MISSHGLQYQYLNGPALAFPDLDVPQGGVLLLRGRSGSGKSTWLALAAGLLGATHGTLTVAGQALGALKPIARDAWRARAIGFLPQKLHLSEALTVEGNLALAYFAAGLAKDAAAIRRALDALGVAHLARRRPAQLSGGQAQRVALARAVLLNPQVILVDEPTASLDDEAARDALDLLKRSAARANATLVIATHDARVVEALPQAAVVLFDDKIRLQPSSNMPL